MSQNFLSPHDPKFTAYALGELEPEERAAVEALLRDNPAARAIVEEIRATAVQLSAALAAEPLPESGKETSTSTASAAVGTAHPAPRNSGHLPAYEQRKFIRFPQFYYIAGFAAAACFALFVALREPIDYPTRERAAKQEKTYTIINFPPLPAEESPEPMPRRVEEAAADAPAPFAPAAGPAASKQRLAEAAPPSAAGPLIDSRATFPRWPGSQLPLRQPQPAEGAFRNVAQYPSSTFAIDGETTHYSDIRRSIESGRLPPKDAIRIEEMINYFPYGYAEPGPDQPFGTTLEVASAPWDPTHRLVLIGLKGRAVAAKVRPSANLVFLLDVSSSMYAPNKLPLVKESMRLLVAKLRPDDRVAIVAYAGRSGLVLPSTPASRSSEILDALETLSPVTSTPGAIGIELAYDIANANFVSGGLNRVILCTGGDFNIGVTNEGELTRLIEEKAKSGLLLTAVGFGMGAGKDATLEKFATRGKGDHGYVATRRDADKLMLEQVNGPVVAMAKDVKVEVAFDPEKVASYRLIGYGSPPSQKDLLDPVRADAAEISTGQIVTALYEIIPPVAAENLPDSKSASARVAAQSKQKINTNNGLLSVKISYKKPGGFFNRTLEFPLIDRGRQFAEASDDFKFAAAVASFGMILRDFPQKGNATLGDIIAWAAPSDRGDAAGRRREFVSLVNAARRLMQ